MPAASRTILVTGCSSGIGACCARALKAEGWRVIATARRPEDLARLGADGFETLPLDYRDGASVAACAHQALALTDGRLFALFNNGAHAQPGAVEDLPVAALREQFEANLFGWHDLTVRLLPAMRAAGEGRIVQCSSILGRVTLPLRGAYAASKFALEGLSATLALELAGSGVHVSLIEPGGIPSRIAHNALPFVERYIDTAGSVHRAAYARRLAQLRAGGTAPAPGNSPALVMDALRHALTARRPRLRYVVTREAKIGALAARLLPDALLVRLLRDRA